MDRESLTIVVYCQIDTVLAEMAADPEWRRIRQRGPAPVLADAEVLPMAVVGEFLGLDQDAAIYRSFRSAHPDWFPALMRLHRTTFAQQAANVWVVTEQLWQRLRDRVAHDPTLSCIDRGPIPVCRFGRAYRCALPWAGGLWPRPRQQGPVLWLPAASAHLLAGGGHRRQCGAGQWARSGAGARGGRGGDGGRPGGSP